MSSIAPPVAVPKIPMAMPRSRRGHHWVIILIPGAQQAALTNPAIPQGTAMVRVEVAKLVIQLKTAVRTAPSSIHNRRPYFSAKRPWTRSPKPKPQSSMALMTPISRLLSARSSLTSGETGQKLKRPR